MAPMARRKRCRQERHERRAESHEPPNAAATTSCSRFRFWEFRFRKIVRIGQSGFTRGSQQSRCFRWRFRFRRRRLHFCRRRPRSRCSVSSEFFDTAATHSGNGKRRQRRSVVQPKWRNGWRVRRQSESIQKQAAVSVGAEPAIRSLSSFHV